jgi:hypothetical protein
VSKLGFIGWLRKTRITPDAAGDFIADARRDRTFPRRLKDSARLKQYLCEQGADDRVIRAAEAAWDRFKRGRTE